MFHAFFLVIIFIMWTFKELKELLLLICISQIPFCPNVESEATTDSTSFWQWQYNLCQPRPIFQIGENDISLPSASCLKVWWACYLWWRTISKLLFSISWCKHGHKWLHCPPVLMPWHPRPRSQLAWAWDSRRWSDGHGDTALDIWRMTGQASGHSQHHIINVTVITLTVILDGHHLQTILSLKT